MYKFKKEIFCFVMADLEEKKISFVFSFASESNRLYGKSRRRIPSFLLKLRNQTAFLNGEALYKIYYFIFL